MRTDGKCDYCGAFLTPWYDLKPKMATETKPTDQQCTDSRTMKNPNTKNGKCTIDKENDWTNKFRIQECSSFEVTSCYDPATKVFDNS